jgi:translation initiation factor 1
MARQKKSHKNRVGVVYSTDPDFNYTMADSLAKFKTDKAEKELHVRFEKKGRGGKHVTVIDNFTGSDNDLKSLAKTLKTSCGVGGTAKDGMIVIQGNFVEKIMDILREEGYQVKKTGG